MSGGNLLSLRHGTGTRAIAFVHSASGSIGGFRRLLPHLDPGMTIVAFEAGRPGPEDRCSITAIAEDYLSELADAVQVDRTVLVGWSFGGPVAVELARLAEIGGTPPDAVILLDSATPAVLCERQRSGPVEIAALFGVQPPRMPPDSSDDAVLDAIAGALSVVSPGLGITADDLAPFVTTYRWHLKAARAGWSGLPCRAPVTLVRAAEESGWGDAPDDLGWSAVFDRPLTRRWAAGTHHTLTDPEHAARLAGLIEDVVAARTP
jgi:thioesterase domain-containing protein